MFCALELFGCWSRSAEELAWIELEEAAAMVQPFAPDEKERRAKVVRVLDGETIQAVIKNGDQIESHRVRLTGESVSEPQSDPERRSRLVAKRAEEYGCCFITLGKEDEFGRRLGAAVSRKGENLHDYLNRMAALEKELAASGLISAPLPVEIELIVSESKS